jgi:hypothetical protein
MLYVFLCMFVCGQSSASIAVLGKTVVQGVRMLYVFLCTYVCVSFLR